MIVDIAWNDMRVEARRALMGEGGTWDVSGDGADGAWAGDDLARATCSLAQGRRLQAVTHVLNPVVRCC